MRCKPEVQDNSLAIEPATGATSGHFESNEPQDITKGRSKRRRYPKRRAMHYRIILKSALGMANGQSAVADVGVQCCGAALVSVPILGSHSLPGEIAAHSKSTYVATHDD